jgi:hypothetical protein
MLDNGREAKQGNETLENGSRQSGLEIARRQKEFIIS